MSSLWTPAHLWGKLYIFSSFQCCIDNLGKLRYGCLHNPNRKLLCTEFAVHRGKSHSGTSLLVTSLKSKIGLDLVHGVSCQYFNIWFLNCWNYCSTSELLHTMPWFKIILSITRERKNTGFLLHLYLFIFLVHVLFYAIKSRTWPIFLIFWIKNH